MENKRQKAILEIIGNCAIETQDELIEKLKERDMNCAQATISRDIKRLHLIKEPCAGGYRYVRSDKHINFDLAERLQRVLHDYGTSVDYANNLVLFRTLPSLGMAAGAAFDSMNVEQMLGCISGDDTVVIIMRSSDAAAEFCAALTKICEKSGAK